LQLTERPHRRKGLLEYGVCKKFAQRISTERLLSATEEPRKLGVRTSRRGWRLPKIGANWREART
jgi:hypothetical protein